jgi:hypothetical protein
MGRRKSVGADTSLDYNEGDQDSIFGPTYEGVPNPQIPHTHPYPTRYHGYVDSRPRFFLPYRKASYEAPAVQAWKDPADARAASQSATAWLQFPTEVPALSGFGGGCGCTQGVGGSPDGLGQGLGEPLLCAGTGSTLMDAVLGGVVGWLAAPRKEGAPMWAAAGAGAAALAGTLGIVGVAGTALYVRGRARSTR